MFHHRTIVLLAIACALILRMAVPSGWMPVASAHGTLVLAPCPAAAPTPMDHSGHHPGAKKDQHKAKDTGDCAFAPFHAGMDVADSTELLPASLRAEAGPAAAFVTSYLATGPPAPPPPARGPPTLT